MVVLGAFARHSSSRRRKEAARQTADEGDQGQARTAAHLQLTNRL